MRRTLHAAVLAGSYALLVTSARAADDGSTTLEAGTPPAMGQSPLPTEPQPNGQPPPPPSIIPPAGAIPTEGWSKDLVTPSGVGASDLGVNGPHGNMSFQQFYDELSQYGSWIQTPDYGWVWLPAGEPADWEPYTTGAWQYSPDYGYVWMADEPWGWATFHYGNWISTPSYGWAWVPGYTWGPGWVDWYYGAGYVGWAPLSPFGFGYGYGFGGYGYGYGYGYGGYGYYGYGYTQPQRPNTAPDVRNNVRGAIDPKHYVYVPANKLTGQRITHVMERPTGISPSVFGQMQHVNRLPNLARAGGLPQLSAGTAPNGVRVLDGSHAPGAVPGQRVDGRFDGPRSAAGANGVGGVHPAQSAVPSAVGMPGQHPFFSATPRVSPAGGMPAFNQSALPRLSPTPRIMPSSSPVAARPTMPVQGRMMPAPGRTMPTTRMAPMARPMAPRAGGFRGGGGFHGGGHHR